MWRAMVGSIAGVACAPQGWIIHSTLARLHSLYTIAAIESYESRCGENSMNRSTLAAVVVALLLGSGIAGYLAGRPGDFLDRAPVTASTAKPAAPTTPAKATMPA